MPWTPDSSTGPLDRLALVLAACTGALAVAFAASGHRLLAVPCAVAALLTAAVLVRQQRHARRTHGASARLAHECQVLLDNPLVGTLRRSGNGVASHNRALAGLLGHGPDTLQHRALPDLFADADGWAAVNQASAGALRGDGRFRLQVRMRRQDGSAVWVDLSGTQLGAQEALWVVLDIDEAKRAEESARALALRDVLTGLPNRRLFDEKLADALAHARRSSQRMALCLVDLDGFKTLNGLLGQAAGDRMLREVGLRLPGCVRGNDVVARLEGDTFALVLHQVPDAEAAMPVVRRCLDELARPVTLPSSEPLTVRARIGIVLCDGHRAPEALVQLAEQAAEDAKRAGPDRVHVHAEPAAG